MGSFWIEGCRGYGKEPKARVEQLSILLTDYREERDEDVDGKKFDAEAESGAPLQSLWQLKVTSKEALYKWVHLLIPVLVWQVR